MQTAHSAAVCAACVQARQLLAHICRVSAGYDLVLTLKLVVSLGLGLSDPLVRYQCHLHCDGVEIAPAGHETAAH